ncbi:MULTISPECIES: hypothetical protein [Halomonas]|uniref:hypothetical protein n=1 Tax=Halomonas TaxID=2745 RepID=UPI001C9A1405|nr:MULTISPECIES: hypothetical protein [Halomonas]MBY5968443.1 hypothetical protein [Halomonas denitrificans]MBY5984180.1 hypothetical protein [Halomonas sp. DP5Y7-2]
MKYLIQPRHGAPLALLLALGSGMAQADAERLEADLKTMLGGEGTLEIGDVSDELFGSTTSAEDLVLTGPDGERLSVARYLVEGDYESPDEVVLEEVELIDRGASMTLTRLSFEEPGQAVLDLRELPWGQDNPLAGLRLEGLVMDQSEGSVGADLPWGEFPGQINIDSLEATELSQDAIGSLVLSGLTGAFQGDEDLGTGTFALPSLSLTGLKGMEGDSPTVDVLELSDFSLDSDRVVASLASLVADGDMTDGAYSGRMEGLALDLAKMIELAPADERTQLRMVANVLTGGTGQLTLDADMDGTWEAQGSNGQVASRFTMTARDALRIGFDSDLPVNLPKGQDPATYFAGLNDWTELDLQGGDVSLDIGDLGVFGRIAPVIAATQGVSEDALLEQFRTQAEGFGIMMGPQIGAVLSGIVKMMAGEASSMQITTELPPSQHIQKLAKEDPMGLPDALSMQVTVE